MFPRKQSRMGKNDKVLRSEFWHTKKFKKHVGGDVGILRGEVRCK